MTRFSRDYGKLLSDAQDVRRREQVEKECGLGNVEFVNITGMGVSRIPAPESHGAESAMRKPAEASRPSDRSATVASAYPLVRLCKAHGLPEPLPEYRFHKERRWRFDFAWPIRCVAVEIEGGIWTQGRHTRGAGALEDMRKYSAAALLGWRILYYQPDELSMAIADLRLEFAR